MSDDEDQPASSDDLATELANLARALEEQEDVQATLDTLVAATAGTIPDAQHVSTSAVRRRREVTTRASTNDLSRAVDRAQYETGQGPCLDEATIADRTSGPIFATATGRALDRSEAWRLIRRLATAAGIASAERISPHWMRQPTPPPHSMPASPCATCRTPWATPTPAPPACTTGAGTTSTATPPTPSPPCLLTTDPSRPLRIFGLKRAGWRLYGPSQMAFQVQLTVRPLWVITP